MRIEKQCSDLPRLHAGSGAYPGLRYTPLIAIGFYLHRLQLYEGRFYEIKSAKAKASTTIRNRRPIPN
jgi:hypothetical protein